MVLILSGGRVVGSEAHRCTQDSTFLVRASARRVGEGVVGSGAVQRRDSPAGSGRSERRPSSPSRDGRKRWRSRIWRAPRASGAGTVWSRCRSRRGSTRRASRRSRRGIAATRSALELSELGLGKIRDLAPTQPTGRPPCAHSPRPTESNPAMPSSRAIRAIARELLTIS